MNLQKFSNVTLILLVISIIGYFAVFFQTQYNLKSPLIPSEVTMLIYEDFAKAGLFTSIGLLISTLFRIYKKLTIVVAIDLLILLGQQVLPKVFF